VYTTVLLVATATSCIIAALLSVSVWVLHAGARNLPHGSRPISVLKPVKGLDDELEENLESFCRQVHPQFEVIVGAADPQDPALAVARRVKRRHPEVAIRIVSGEWHVGQNPKVRNLRNLLTVAKYQSILVSDGDVRVEPDYLSVMAAALERPGVGLVSNLVVGIGDRSLGAACENLQLNSFVVGCVAAADMMAHHPVVVGKSMLFRRDALTNAGGFAAAADVLAEDYLLGRAVTEAGYRVVTLGYPVWAVNRDWSVERMVRRHTRWSQIRRNVAPLVFLLEPLGHPLLWLGLLLTTTMTRLNTSHPTALAVAAASAMVGATVLLQSFSVSQFEHGAFRISRLSLLPLQSSLALLAWARAWVETVVVWRQQSYRIGPGSRLLPIVSGTLAEERVRARWSAAA
jgi:ceramide glucosyltransferase